MGFLQEVIMQLFVLLLTVLLAALLAKVLWDKLFQKVTIFEYERAVEYRNGKFHKVVDPGAYWIRPTRTTINKVDVRPRFAIISGQEVLTLDAITLKVTLAAQYKVVDPATAILKSESYYTALYTVLQLGLREIIGTANIDELLETRNTIGQRLSEKCAPGAQEIGLELMSVNIKDIMFPGDLKKVFAQVVKARKEGQAALERARGETAALRNLANAAKLIENNPALMQVRLLQSVTETSGHTLVMGMPANTAPLPVKARTGEAPQIQSEMTETLDDE
jgi:regulator of protease activity HflC (stomatin/prohibitin superfamily)